MFALKRKILWLILICTSLTALVVGSMSLVMSIQRVRADSDLELMLRCDRTAMEVESVLESIRVLAEFCHMQIQEGLRASPGVVDDGASLRAFTERYEERIAEYAQYTHGCMAVYVRYDLSLPADGFFYVRGSNRIMSKAPLTPIGDYSPDDTEHVGWYYEPLRAGHAIWMAPYDNLNIGRPLISYVIPIHYEDRIIGVVGMDIDFEYVGDFVRNLEAYGSGYAFATYGDQLVIHRDYGFYTPVSGIDGLYGLDNVLKKPVAEREKLGNYTYLGVEKRYARKTLSSGIDIFLCAPESEIYADTDDLMKKLIAVIVCSVVLVFLIMNGMLNRFIRLATRDALTGLANRERFGDFFAKEQERTGMYHFFLMDIDKFKRINDTFGHDQGDRVLCRVADALRNIESGGMVARWGGDEFVGMLHADEIDGKLRALSDELGKVNDRVYGQISVSVGVCDIPDGISLVDLTKKADVGMYLSKQHAGCHVTRV